MFFRSYGLLLRRLSPVLTLAHIFHLGVGYTQVPQKLWQSNRADYCSLSQVGDCFFCQPLRGFGTQKTGMMDSGGLWGKGVAP